LCRATEIQKVVIERVTKHRLTFTFRHFMVPYWVICMNFMKCTRNIEIMYICLSINLSEKLLNIFRCNFIFVIHIKFCLLSFILMAVRDIT
jgi:hypothetical protein